MSIAQRLVNLSDGLSAEGILSAAKGGTGTTTGAGSSTPTISSINYGGDDTATNPAGGATITLTGTNFASGAKVLINITPVSVVTVVSSTQITFTAPALSAGSYILYVVNLDGSTAIAVPGIQYSGTPAWTTAAGSLGTNYETAPVSTAVAATSDSAVTYSVVSGTLPGGVTINSSGTISGTSPLVGGSTTYTFTVRATDVELQDTDRQFSLTINPDVVVWSNPTSDATLTGTPGVAYTSNLVAASAAGQAVTYSANELPAGLTLSGSTISGTPTTPGTSATTLTATSAVTNKTAQVTISWTINIASDTYFKYTTLLLNGENTAQPFLADASVNNFSLTAYGDTKPSNFNPYTPGYYSVQFNGTSDYLSIPHSPNLVFGSSGYSVECWVYMTSLTAGQYIWNKNGVSGSKYPSVGLQWDGTKFRLVYGNSTGLSTVEYVNFNTIPNILNNWVHIAIQINGSTIQSWVNGVYQPDTYVLQNLPVDNAQPFYIGGQSGATSNATGLFSGYISNLRVIMGGFYYDGSTTARTLPPVPASPVQSVSINSYYVASGETQLVACNSNRFIDLSSNNHTVNRVGTPKISSYDPYTPNLSYSTYGSTYFDGTGDYVTYTGGSTTTLSADFTLECWVYLNNLSANQPIICIGDGYNLGALFFIDTAGKLRLYANNVQILTGTGTVTANTWNHVAFVRSGTTVTAYLNGVAGGTATSSSQWSGTTTYIGMEIYNTGAGIQLAGYLTDLRLVKGTAVYTAAFTPPTQPLTAVVNTSLLTCQTNQPHTNNTFLDNSSNALAITRTGNSTQGAFSPYGANWSNYFDGSGDWIATPSGTTTVMGGGFAGNIISFETWIYPLNFNSGSYDQFITSSYAAVAANGRWAITLQKTANSTATLGFAYTTSTSSQNNLNSTAAAINLNQWNHIAVTVDATSSANSTVKLFANGILLNTFTAQNLSSQTSYYGNPLIGGANSMYASEFNGYISNYRILKGAFAYTSNYTVPVEPLQPTANTVILTCQSPSIVDNSVNNLALSKSGDVRVEKFSPFSTVTQTPQTHSVYFDGSGDYLTIPDNNPILRLSNNSFTIEAWIYLTNTSTGTLVSQWQGGGGYAFLVYVTGNGNMAFYWNNTGSYTTTSSPFTTNQWMHVAIVKNGTASNNGAIYVNGVLKDALFTIPSINGSTAAVSIGYNLDGANSFTGSISNFRIVNGTAVYTTNFTPPTAPLTAITNTSLLTCQSATIVDNSTNAFTITAYGNTVPRQQNPFGFTTSAAQDYTTSVFGSSAYFDGSDYLEFPLTNNTFKFGTGEFTIEFWVYPTSAPNNNWTPFFTIGGSGGGQEIRISQNINMGSGYGYLIPNSANNADIYPSFGNFNLFEWHHLALVRSGTTVSFYRNGVLVGTTTSATFNFTNTSVGRIAYPQPAYADGSYIGYMSDVRIANKALYTSSFVPPSAPMQAVSGTVLLLNMDKSAIQDKSGKVVLETAGDAKVSTSVRKYGTSSLYFDGTGDYLTFPSNPQYAFGTGDFTVECWVNSANVSSSQKGFLQTSDSAGGLQTNYTSGITFLFGAGVSGGSAVSLSGGVISNIAGTYVGSSTAVITQDTWTHLALVRSNGTATMYVNGVSVGSASATGNCIGTNLVVGGYYSTGYLYNGYLDDLRITKGYARYTANFTPPQQALLTK